LPRHNTDLLATTHIIWNDVLHAEKERHLPVGLAGAVYRSNALEDANVTRDKRLIIQHLRFPPLGFTGLSRNLGFLSKVAGHRIATGKPIMHLAVLGRDVCEG